MGRPQRFDSGDANGRNGSKADLTAYILAVRRSIRCAKRYLDVFYPWPSWPPSGGNAFRRFDLTP
jgi:hypothetical protein